MKCKVNGLSIRNKVGYFPSKSFQPHAKHVVNTSFLSDRSQIETQLVISGGEETSREMATQGSRTRSLSSCEAEWSLLQHLQLHLTLKRCVTESQWRRGSEVLGCTSITCTQYLLSLAKALRDGNRSARIRVEEDLYPTKPRSWMS